MAVVGIWVMWVVVAVMRVGEWFWVMNSCPHVMSFNNYIHFIPISHPCQVESGTQHGIIMEPM